MNQIQFLLLCLAGWINRNQQNVIEYLQEEVKVLKEQLGRQPRFNDAQRRRLAAKAKQIGLKHLQGIATLATPRTLLDWHHRLVAGKYDSFGQRSPWRPPTAPELRALILRMAAENRTWGYTRIQGALQNLGHEIGRGTIAKILQEAGVDPVWCGNSSEERKWRLAPGAVGSTLRRLSRECVWMFSRRSSARFRQRGERVGP